ncbi:superoxide dismutase, Cu-Zn family [Streptomyces zhaozhouensis]|uniref:Superoxide dismutase, Cu-Zn family n=1 Tax=Streptomyces zhaozhouensis TaxID=1300267 RepID=A0A286DNJ0_9ACTN|nr:superoxide dismutase family protein [Streptomyces zhaozhouensis]SOD60200.1 superoxide dismutase, Cu-Zn family [Streptomyces zhaozhouensis]
MGSLVTRGLAALLAALASTGGTALAAERAGQPEGVGREVAQGWLFVGEFAPVGAGGTDAVTYDEELVAAGATVEVVQWVGDGRTRVELRVDGLVPGHTYGTHVHTEPCGPDPADSGPHYQHEPSDRPGAANPSNEVWLDLTADGEGAGAATARQDWYFRAGEANSVVVHEHATSRGHHGTPGDAGARVACFTVPFRGVPVSATAEAETLPAPPIPARPSDAGAGRLGGTEGE